ncbi:LysE/ArgO family amino acid transporter [Undibacterium arcticum]|uniref:LysE/ArgO family amino acid transporter n=1 Tax=Undibacterium arcticum TaxID=1762892 RepID=A0ABV7EYP9_9BURK
MRHHNITPGCIMLLPFYFKGLGLGGGLIMAIGSQNAHLLRMGLRRQHVGLTVLVCVLCDMILIAAGVAGMGAAIEGNSALLNIARWGGAAFLVWYGVRAWRAVLNQHTLNAASATTTLSAAQALSAILALSLLNPHVYLDTVVLLGAIGGQQAGPGKLWFALGAMSASTLWFIALGFGARLLTPWFARPAAWRMLDGVIGLVMFGLAASLMTGAAIAH